MDEWIDRTANEYAEIREEEEIEEETGEIVPHLTPEEVRILDLLRGKKQDDNISST